MDTVEKLLLFLLLATSLLGIYWGFQDPQFFNERYMMEDGVIEYGTVVLLLASCGLITVRWLRLRKVQTYYFTLVSWFMFLLFFFIAGEELSWGQRIMEIETTEYFNENNSQQELNLHNLVVGGVKINKLIFGLVLTTVIMIYMVLIPFLYHRLPAVKKLLDRIYIPIPRLRHSFCYLLLTGVVAIIPASKNWELLEFGSVLVFFLILWTPQNSSLFSEEDGK